MEGQSGLSELSIISWVSAVEGCLFSGVPLYNISGYTFWYQALQENIKKATDTQSPLQEENLIHVLNRRKHLTLPKKSVELLGGTRGMPTMLTQSSVTPLLTSSCMQA